MIQPSEGHSRWVELFVERAWRIVKEKDDPDWEPPTVTVKAGKPKTKVVEDEAGNLRT
jgi:hypothetical protein